jgi:hypothetical protein
VQGYQAQNVDAIRAERIVCTVRAGQLRVKAFQLVFHRDGSFFITFPYFRHRTGLLSISTIPSNGSCESQVNLEHGGKVTSHLVKHSHHVDGRAHFSQDGKIFTAIKRQSIALDKQHGHLFSLLIQGLNALDPAEDEFQSTKRAAMPTIGPVVPGLDPDGNRTDQIFTASPYTNARHVLAISCVPISALGPEAEIFLFYGGFSSPDIMTDPHQRRRLSRFLVSTRRLREIARTSWERGFRSRKRKCRKVTTYCKTGMRSHRNENWFIGRRNFGSTERPYGPQEEDSGQQHI